MKRRLLVLVLVLHGWAATSSWGQGLVPTPPDQYNQIPVFNPGMATVAKTLADGRTVMEVRSVPVAALPPRYDLGENLPKPARQDLGDCVGWAVGRALYSQQLALYRNRQPREDWDVFSPTYIYSQIHAGGPQDGSHIFHQTAPNAVALVKEQGCASLATAPYDSSSSGWNAPPSDRARREAANFKAFYHERLTDLDSIKRAIVADSPVILGVRTDAGFHNSADTSIYRWSSDPLSGYHAICAVGYSDGKQAVRLMNSWGDDWKDGGFCWVAYDQFQNISSGHWLFEAHLLRVTDATLPQGVQVGGESFYLETDHSVSKDNTPISTPNFARHIAATDQYLYALGVAGEVFAYTKVLGQHAEWFEWQNISDYAPPSGLGGQLSAQIAASPEYLYAATNSGRVYGRIPGVGSQRRWERIDLPSGAKCIDLRSRGGKVYATSQQGDVFRRDAGVGWTPTN